jgi:hypothetical protein
MGTQRGDRALAEIQSMKRRQYYKRAIKPVEGRVYYG